MTTNVKFKGVNVTLGDRVFVVPPLNFRQLQVFQDRLNGFSGGVDPASVALVLEVTHAAIGRNYPDVTTDELAELLDVGNIQDVMEAVMDVSGLKRKAQEASATTGDPSPGVASTPT